MSEPSDPAFEPFAQELRTLIPSGAEVLDVHTHLGTDEDGMAMSPPELLGLLDEAGAQRACVFPLHDPERHPAYSLPNDRVLEWAAASEGRFVPFCRLDPAEDPLREAERCLANGARGIKLHPRAQTFGFAEGAADGIFSIAEQARVPVLIHAGRGMPPIAEGLIGLAERHPDIVLVLAHCGVADQGLLVHGLADHPGVLFDTSWFTVLDHLGLFARLPPERIVFGSDPPYGRPFMGLYLVLRLARALEMDEQQTRAMLGGTVAAALERRPLPAPSAPIGSPTLTVSVRLARVYQYGLMAFPAFMTRDMERALEMVDLGLAACRDPDPGPDGPALQRIAHAFEGAKRLVAVEGQERLAIGLVFLALIVAGTEPAVAV